MLKLGNRVAAVMTSSMITLPLSLSADACPIKCHEEMVCYDQPYECGQNADGSPIICFEEKCENILICVEEPCVEPLPEFPPVPIPELPDFPPSDPSPF
jgi:hypothetical protein